MSIFSSLVFTLLAVLAAFEAEKTWVRKNLQFAVEKGTTYEPGILGRLGLFLIAVAIEVVFHLPIRFFGLKGVAASMIALIIIGSLAEYYIGHVTKEMISIVLGVGCLGMPILATVGAGKEHLIVYLLMIMIVIIEILVSRIVIPEPEDTEEEETQQLDLAAATATIEQTFRDAQQVAADRAAENADQIYRLEQLKTQIDEAVEVAQNAHDNASNQNDASAEVSDLVQRLNELAGEIQGEADEWQTAADEIGSAKVQLAQAVLALCEEPEEKKPATDIPAWLQILALIVVLVIGGVVLAMVWMVTHLSAPAVDTAVKALSTMI